MSSRSPPRVRPRDAVGRELDGTRAAAAFLGGYSNSISGKMGARGTDVTASSVGGGGGFDADDVDHRRRSSSFSSSSKASSSLPSSRVLSRLLSTPIAPCLAYGAISICITLFNKAVFSVYKFQFPAFVTALQVVLSIFYIAVLSHTGVLDLDSEGGGGRNKKDDDGGDEENDGGESNSKRSSPSSTRTLSPPPSRRPPPRFRLSLPTARKVAPMALLWFGYVASGVAALRYLNVPMYSVLRRATTPLVAAGEFFVLRKRASGKRALALAAMVAGALLASATDLSFSAKGYAWAGVCIVCTAAYLVAVRATGDATRLGPFALQLYNNVLALPLVALWLLGSRSTVLVTEDESGRGNGGGGFWASSWIFGGGSGGAREGAAAGGFGSHHRRHGDGTVTSAVVSSELAAALASPLLGDPRFVAFLLLSASQAFLLNAAIFWCTTANSPLATSVTGQLKDAATTAAGLVLFGDVVFDSRNLAGVALSLAGGIAYAAVAHAEGKKAAATKKKSEENKKSRRATQQQQQQESKGAADRL